MTSTHRESGLAAAARLASLLDEQGYITDLRVREAMARIERHRYLPDRVWLDDDSADGGYAPLDRACEPERWWEAAYGNVPVVTQLDDGRDERLDPHWATPTSSASLPSTVAQMACAAALEVGMETLEIGPATGINLSLIAELVGQEHVVGIEIDAGLAERCRAALAATGYTNVTVVTGDGELGYTPRAKYHRIVSTASAMTIPYAWVAQSHEGGRIICPFQTTLCSQGMVALTVRDGTAAGQFCLPLRFMLLRGQRARHRFDELFTDDAWEATRVHRIDADPALLSDWDARFAAGLRLPGVHHGQRGEGQWLASENAWAYWDDRHVYQWGPQALFDAAREAVESWEKAGKPEMTRYGLTVADSGQRFWLDEPDNLW
ncbi:methyltransferase domain-containing protein [Streptomyces syringium]|uniref:methyltransferase domain-containing protein n=1 Tax=Streptomyces syringium TaxID=76729 RepID=UPI0037D76619